MLGTFSLYEESDVSQSEKGSHGKLNLYLNILIQNAKNPNYQPNRYRDG